MRSLFLSALALAIISNPSVVRAECMASVVTGIDVSASISRDELVMQIDGIDAALRSPAVLSAMQSQGCTRVSVFVWADIEPVVLLPWTDIATEADAARAGAALQQALADYTLKTGTLTAVGDALTFAWHMLSQVPPTGRQIVNIVSNGESNQGPHPAPISAQMRAGGVTINALLFGPSATIEDYYRQNVTGGHMSFVLRVRSADDFAAVYRAKFRLDISMVTR
jgi:hypothetical protein